MDKVLVLKAFEAMLNGKSFRITKESREFWHNPSDQWFTISSIDCNGKLTLFGNNNTILEGADLSEIVKL